MKIHIKHASRRYCIDNCENREQPCQVYTGTTVSVMPDLPISVFFFFFFFFFILLLFQSVSAKNNLTRAEIPTLLKKNEDYAKTTSVSEVCLQICRKK